MSRPVESLGERYFEEMFRGDSDPWGLESRPYEAAKFQQSLSALSGRTYDSGFEVGCAGGALTERLAPRCGSLLAIDISATAVARARRRCAALPQVRIDQMAFPTDQPERGAYDLIVLSEVAYYWNDADLDRAAAAIDRLWAAGGDLLLVHWTGDTDYPQSADDAVGKLGAALPADRRVLVRERREHYRLDLWRRA